MHCKKLELYEGVQREYKHIYMYVFNQKSAASEVHSYLIPRIWGPWHFFSLTSSRKLTFGNGLSSSKWQRVGVGGVSLIQSSQGTETFYFLYFFFTLAFTSSCCGLEVLFFFFKENLFAPGMENHKIVYVVSVLTLNLMLRLCHTSGNFP